MHVMVQDADLPRGRAFEPDQMSHQRALSPAAGSDDRKNLASMQREGQIPVQNPRSGRNVERTNIEQRFVAHVQYPRLVNTTVERQAAPITQTSALTTAAVAARPKSCALRPAYRPSRQPARPTSTA